MRDITDAETDLINNSEYTHNYESYLITESITIDVTVENNFISIFESDIKDLYTESNDLGGLIVYFNNDKLVAFYDYERFVGTVF